MATEQREVPVSLRPVQGPALFLPSRQVVFRDGAPEPIEHEGRQYIFSHTTSSPGYGGTQQSVVYVFTDRPLDI